MPYPHWTHTDCGLVRKHPRWGKQYVMVAADRDIPGNVFITFTSGEGRDYRYVQHSLDVAAADHVMDLIDNVLDAPVQMAPVYADDPLHKVHRALEAVG